MRVVGIGIGMLALVLCLSGCGSSGGGGDGVAVDTAILSGEVDTGSLAQAVERAAALPGLQEDLYVVAVDETGRVVDSHRIPFPFGGGAEAFTLTVPTGHDYLVEFRAGSVDGPTAAVLEVSGGATARAVFSLSAGALDANLGQVTIDLVASRGQSDEDLSGVLEPPSKDYDDLDEDILPDDFDRDDDDDGISDDGDDFPRDTDNDHRSNDVDDDDDGDGIIDDEDEYPYDTDNDGLRNCRDDDDDGDGVGDDDDEFPLDDDLGRLIDPTRWTTYEFVRTVEDGRLRSALTRRGSNYSNWLGLAVPDGVQSISAEVQVNHVAGAGAFVRARVGGFLYNDGTGGDGSVGDVFAVTEIRYDGADLAAGYLVARCAQSECQNDQDFEVLEHQAAAFGAVDLEDVHTLSVSFDGSVLTFGCDGEARTYSPSTTVQDLSAEAFLGLGTRVQNITEPEEWGFIEAEFDDVHVDGNLYDDFEGDVIDRSRWIHTEFERRIKDGQLRSALTRYGSSYSNTLNVVDPTSVQSLRADVTVTEIEHHGFVPRARVIGNFFHDDTVTGDGDAGEVYAAIGVRVAETGGAPFILYFVGRCENANCTDSTGFGSGSFGTVALNEPHTLSVAYDGATTFTFAADDGEPATIDVAGQATRSGPAEIDFMGVGTRVSADAPGAEAWGRVEATFDDVYVNGELYDTFGEEEDDEDAD